MDIGQLRIQLYSQTGEIRQVDIQSTRPSQITGLFIDKTPNQALRTLPLLFSICNIAQSFAGFLACSRALGISEDPRTTAARQLLLNVEIIREHCWWLLIHTDKAKLAVFIRLVNQFKQALFVNGEAFQLASQLQVDKTQLENLLQQIDQSLDELFRGTRTQLLEVENELDLQHWLKDNRSIPAECLREIIAEDYQQLGSNALELLPALTDQDLHQFFSQHPSNDFERFPDWQGRCYENSSLNRQQQHPLIANLLQKHGNGLLPRFASRVLELAKLPAQLRQNQHDLVDRLLFPPAGSNYKNTGLAQIQTSRGLLIHYVELDQGLISRYQIIAPTEWNFHPHGIAAQSLKQLSAENNLLLRQQADSLINTLDPCVSYELIIDSI